MAISVQKTIKVRLTLLEEILGTSPINPNIYKDYIASKSENPEKIAEEMAALPEQKDEDKTNPTIFSKEEDGTPFIWDYQIRGFFKDACGMLQRVAGKDENGKKKKAVNESGKITNYKKVIDGLIFVSPRKIHFNLSGEMGVCERPLRGMTAQGERIALAKSETIPAGSTIEFEIQLLSTDHINAVIEWLDYGIFRGLGQWRNSGKGKFTYEILNPEEVFG